MIKAWLSIFFLFLTVQICQAQVKKQQSHVIVDPVEKASFVLKRTKEYITLPDSLRGHAVNGFVMVRVSVTKDAKHRLERVMKLNIADPGIFTLTYVSPNSSKEPFPKALSSFFTPYYGLISKYVKENVHFIPANNDKVEPITFFYFMIRFK
jgi:hypothetical protein